MSLGKRGAGDAYRLLRDRIKRFRTQGHRKPPHQNDAIGGKEEPFVTANGRSFPGGKARYPKAERTVAGSPHRYATDG
jgi:hypothetical protein